MSQPALRPVPYSAWLILPAFTGLPDRPSSWRIVRRSLELFHHPLGHVVPFSCSPGLARRLTHLLDAALTPAKLSATFYSSTACFLPRVVVGSQFPASAKLLLFRNRLEIARQLLQLCHVRRPPTIASRFAWQKGLRRGAKRGGRRCDGIRQNLDIVQPHRGQQDDVSGSGIDCSRSRSSRLG